MEPWEEDENLMRQEQTIYSFTQQSYTGNALWSEEGVGGQHPTYTLFFCEAVEGGCVVGKVGIC